MCFSHILYYILSYYLAAAVYTDVPKNGLLLLYRPLDVSNECAFSGNLRYDLSFGMGMSDTITMVFRTLNGIDYECSIEIAAQSPHDYLIVVIKFPTSLLKNCFANEDAFMVIKKNKCLRLCELLGDRNLYSTYFVITVKGRLRFRFLSNSSINSDINAEMYQVTATTAREKPDPDCQTKNETLCVIDRKEYCFTNGVVCDGIINCGAKDWFDERQAECSLPIEYLGYAPTIAVVGALACALLAGGHIIIRCLPPQASSFFIFNANEDNRLCIDPLLCPPQHATSKIEKVRRVSLIPVTSSTSSDTTTDATDEESTPTNRAHAFGLTGEKKYSDTGTDTPRTRTSLVRTMTARLQETLRSVSGRRKLLNPSVVTLKVDNV